MMAENTAKTQKFPLEAENSDVIAMLQTGKICEKAVCVESASLRLKEKSSVNLHRWPAARAAGTDPRGSHHVQSLFAKEDQREDVLSCEARNHMLIHYPEARKFEITVRSGPKKIMPIASQLRKR